MQAKEANTIEDVELLKRKGLEPIDFLKYSLPLPGDVVDDIVEMGLDIEKGMVEKEHPWNSIGEDLLQCICLPDGSKIRSKIPQATELYHRCEDMQIIPGLLEATLTLAEERAKGRKSYRNFTRRLKRSAAKRKAELEEARAKFIAEFADSNPAEAAEAVEQAADKFIAEVAEVAESANAEESSAGEAEEKSESPQP